MSARIDDFNAQLIGGGARPSLFRVIGGFPSGASGLISQASGLAGALGVPTAVTNAITSVSNALGAGGPGRQLSFLCSEAVIPEETIGLINIQYRGRDLKLPGDRAFGNLTLTVINDTSFRVRDEFERWTELIQDRVNIVGVGSLALAQTWKVQQLGRQNEVLKEYEFVGCWPSSVGQIALSYTQKDAIETYPVTLEYQYFKSGKPGFGSALNAITATF
jgi:hypothetical protein